MQYGNVMGFWSVMKREDFITKGCFIMKTGHCCQVAVASHLRQRQVTLLLFFSVEALLSRYLGPLKAMLESRLPFLSKGETQLGRKRGMKPQSPLWGHEWK